MKAATVLTRALAFGGILTLAVAVVGSVIGYLVDGTGGLLSALVGAALTALFMGFTALSIVLASRATRDRPSSMLYFGIVLGVWLLKFAVFITVLLLVRGQDWMNPYVFFVAVIAAVIGSLVADMVALAGARVPYAAGVEPPGATAPPTTGSNPDS
jgi:hypothetical protein